MGARNNLCQYDFHRKTAKKELDELNPKTGGGSEVSKPLVGAVAPTESPKITLKVFGTFRSHDST